MKKVLLFIAFIAMSMSTLAQTYTSKELEEQAEKGNAGAQGAMGDLYYYGKNGYPVDKKKAFEWWQKAAQNGQPAAMYRIGVQYMNGDGIEKNQEKGMFWMEKSADKGYLDAQFNTGFYYYAKEDYPKAAKYYKMCADQGDEEAKKQLNDPKLAPYIK